MIRCSCLLLGAALFATTTSRAQPPSHPLDLPLDVEATAAALTSVPQNEDMQREYPPLARMMGLPGRSVMTCKANLAGALEDCHVVSEEPAGMGFGAAAVRTAAYFRVRPASREGRPVEGSITIPMHWQMDAEPPAAEGPPPPPVSAASLLLARRVLELEMVAARMQAALRPVLDQSMAQLALSDDAQSGAHVLDAFRLGLSDETTRELERQAHVLALRETTAELTATIAFLESSAGRAWVQAQTQIEVSAPKDFFARVARSSRAHLEAVAAAQPLPGAAASGTKPK